MKDSVLMHYRPHEHQFVERMIDMVERVDERQSPQLTDFLDPRQARIAENVARTFSDVHLSLQGGHPDAERQRALFVPSYWQVELEDAELTFLRIEIPGEYVKLTHGDYLGALLGLGLKRSKIGDLGTHEHGCDLVVTRDIADYIRLHLTQVGRATVHLTEIRPNQFMYQKAQFAEKDFTVMSLRVDAVAGEAFGLSRTKVTEPIKGGKLQLNWQVIDNPAMSVEEGDVISLRGFGRVKILEVGGLSKKGRTYIKIGKYL
jgi:RNA-binding protein YlmH